uniref:Uncharacterized protein n=1 Tax=Timema shepardi TaxID=629360 RepID=A0A7R9AYM9_TIMSH|nr:unnamed protein product [Timema shepardi]
MNRLDLVTSGTVEYLETGYTGSHSFNNKIHLHLSLMSSEPTTQWPLQPTGAPTNSKLFDFAQDDYALLPVVNTTPLIHISRGPAPSSAHGLRTLVFGSRSLESNQERRIWFPAELITVTRAWLRSSRAPHVFGAGISPVDSLVGGRHVESARESAAQTICLVIGQSQAFVTSVDRIVFLPRKALQLAFCGSRQDVQGLAASLESEPSEQRKDETSGKSLAEYHQHSTAARRVATRKHLTALATFISTH